MPRRTYNTRYKHDLSPRQQEVLALIGKGHTNLEIAERLGVTLDGAKYHVSEILAKLDVETREEAAALWRDDRKLTNRLKQRARALIGVRPLTVAGFAGGIACMAAAALLYLPAWLEREPAAPQPCASPFVILGASTQLGNQSSSATVQLQASVSRGPSCMLDAAVAVTFLDAAGNALAVDGNGSTAHVRGAFSWVHLTISADHEHVDITPVADPPGAASYVPPEGDDRFAMMGSIWDDTPYLYWTNWCGEYRDAVTVHVDSAVFGELKPAHFSNPPRCDDPSQPSTVRLAYR